MKKYVFILIALLSYVFVTAQSTAPSQTPVKTNYKWTGTNNEFIRPLKIETKTISGAKIDKWDQALADSLSPEGILVMVKDSASKAVGNYMTWQNSYYDYTSEWLVKLINMAGTTTVKSFPLFSGGINATNGASGDAVMKALLFYLPETTLVTGIRFTLYQAGAYTADNYNGAALYAWNVNKWDSVAYTTNDGNIWKATAGALTTVPFTDTYVAQAGFYKLVTLYNNSAETTNPLFTANTSVSSINGFLPFKIVGIKIGVTALPASFTESDLSVSNIVNVIALY
jgi:hypothetical protein